MAKFGVTQRIPYNGYVILYFASFDAYMISRADGAFIPGMMSESSAKNHIDTVLNK